ncbi:MAG: YcfL family protein, partial [Phycisphaerales bacterium]|nr:YcfL family protein [Phycisphaerales bacterium]
PMPLRDALGELTNMAVAVNSVNRGNFDFGVAMVKNVLTGCASVVVMVVAMGGCASPSWPGVDVDTSLLPNIELQPSVTSRVDAERLHVEIPVRNRTNKSIALEYKFFFIDTNNIQVEIDQSWRSKQIPPRGMETITFTSMTASAADFRVLMRQRKTVFEFETTFK